MTASVWEAYRDLLVIHLDTPEIGPLLDWSTQVSLGTGEPLLQDGAPTDSMYLLLQGHLSVHVEMDGHSIRLGEIEPGNWVGEVAYYTRCGVACSTVTALEPSVLLRLHFADFNALIETRAEVACRLSHVLITLLAQRLRATVNDPVLDPEGKLMMLGDLSVPLERQPHRHAGLLGFVRDLLGVR